MLWGANVSAVLPFVEWGCLTRPSRQLLNKQIEESAADGRGENGGTLKQLHRRLALAATDEQNDIPQRDRSWWNRL